MAAPGNARRWNSRSSAPSATTSAAASTTSPTTTGSGTWISPTATSSANPPSARKQKGNAMHRILTNRPSVGEPSPVTLVANRPLGRGWLRQQPVTSVLATILAAVAALAAAAEPEKSADPKIPAAAELAAHGQAPASPPPGRRRGLRVAEAEGENRCRAPRLGPPASRECQRDPRGARVALRNPRRPAAACDQPPRAGADLHAGADGTACTATAATSTACGRK